MRFIKKRMEPLSFIEWKSKETEDWKPTYSILSGETKSDLHDSLLSEQGFTCCYCGIKINRNISHIEHLYPQSKSDEALKIDFNNLLASCGVSVKLKSVSDSHPDSEALNHYSLH